MSQFGFPSGAVNASEIQGIPISTVTPTDGQVLKYVGVDGKWEPGTGGGGGNLNPLPFKKLVHADSPYTVTETNQTIATESSGGVITILLPASPSPGDWLTIYDYTGADVTHPITIDANGGDIIGAPTYTLSTGGQSVMLSCAGNNGMGGSRWVILAVSSAIPPLPAIQLFAIAIANNVETYLGPAYTTGQLAPLPVYTCSTTTGNTSTSVSWDHLPSGNAGSPTVGRLYKSSDNGLTWTLEITYTFTSLQSRNFINSLTLNEFDLLAFSVQTPVGSTATACQFRLSLS